MLRTSFARIISSFDRWPSNVPFELLADCIVVDWYILLISNLFRENILKLKEEYYKPRDLAEDEELENILDAILKQKAMAMDTGYVADVRF